VFSLASAKLIPYILPALPLLAVLLADAILSRVEDGSATSGFQFAAIVSGLMGVAAMVVAALAEHFSSRYLLMAQRPLLAIGLMLWGGGIAPLAMTRRKSILPALATMTLPIALALLAGTYARIAVEPMRSYAELSRSVAAQAPDASLICYHRYIQSLPFYARR